MTNFFCVLVLCFIALSCKKSDTISTPINNPPTTPSNPAPADGSINISLSPILNWSCKDPDGDSVKYDLYLSTVNPPNTLIFSNLTSASYALTNLDTNKTYYWRVNAKDSKGSATAGPIWRFTTIISSLPVQGLIAYYPFNGNANDESGNGYNGMVNGATLTTDRFGNPNKAYYFNSSLNSTITTQFPGILGSNPRTISFWQTSDNTTNSISMGYGGSYSYNATPGSCFVLAVQKINTNQVQAAADLKLGGISYVINDNGSAWHHYCFIVPNISQPQTRDVQIYRDGILMTTVNSDWGDVAINTVADVNFIIGQFVASQAFQGSLDDIRIYNRALSVQEIQQLYHEDDWPK